MKKPHHALALAYLLYATDCRRDGFPYTAKAALREARALRLNNQ